MASLVGRSEFESCVGIQQGVIGGIETGLKEQHRKKAIEESIASEEPQYMAWQFCT